MVDPQAIFESIQIVISFIDRLQNDSLMIKTMSANVEAAINGLKSIENSEDEIFVHDTLNRALSQLEPVYYGLVSQYGSTSKKSKMRTINDVCYHIALCHRLLGSPDNVIFKWGIDNLFWDKKVYGFDDRHTESLSFVLGNQYKEYLKLVTEYKYSQIEDDFEMTIEDIRAHMP